jgi:cytochrome d ubiquinol oxidase subunit I
MNYPSWDVPLIGSTWVIGLIAIFHVLISHFAVGGGFYLVMAERKAQREGNWAFMEVLRLHSRFFLVLTLVFGAVSGVGIWFAIGLANPETTSTLIHNFVFGWAIEWVFFIVEITAATLYYYTWDKIAPKAHLAIGWVYAGTAWASLVIINGILTFMLTPGEAWMAVAGTGQEASRFWQAFFNPTYWPSLVLRTLVCIAMAGVWALVTASRLDGEKQGAAKEQWVRWSVRWLVPAFVLMPISFLWYLASVPEASRQLLSLGIATIGTGIFTQVTRAALVAVMASATILALVYFLAWRSPREFSFGPAFAVLFLALAATASTEHARELIRKPYTISGFMYSNGVRKYQVDGFNEKGYLAHSPFMLPAGTSPAAAGKRIFQGQCLSCHTVDGYRSMRRLLRDRDPEALANIVGMLHRQDESSPYRAFMPPLVGTEEERQALVEYLGSLTREAEVAQLSP